jgi:DNA-3-methyladenine glycosylase II
MDISKSIKLAEKKLQELDPKLGGLIKHQKRMEHRPPDNYFFSLSRSIVSQQVSVASAAAIFRRLESETKMLPAAVVSLNDEQVKKIGLSRQKAAYLHDLAQHFVDDPALYNHLEKCSDNEVIEQLTAVKGIGAWTAQMFLMFTLSRLDIFAPDDVGLQRAMIRLYGWKKLPPKRKLEQIANKWRPYRTVACWHLWQSLKNLPV